MAARVKIGIPVYGNVDHLEMLLETIRWYTYLDEPYDIVVCDDGTPSEVALKSIETVCANFGVTLIKHETNLGIPATWNHLALSLDDEAEIIVILNDDILVVPDWLRVCVHFLDENKENKHVGSMFWNPRNYTTKAMMRAIKDTLATVVYETHEVATGADADFLGAGPFEARIGEGQGLGSVMCMCGCCFAFRRDVFHEVGLFDERFTSFHEESDWGTRAAQIGLASFGFSYPRPYHALGSTFAQHDAALNPTQRMLDSRRLYREKYSVPPHVDDTKYFEFVNQQLMPKIPKTRLKYLRPEYDEQELRVYNDQGDIVLLPKLVEYCESF